MPTISLDHLGPHPANANRMPAALFAKLKTHIERSGDYPPLIVRRHPTHPDRFQILDGHHRAEALRQLGYEHARCDIWEVADDHRATLLLLTLNRLHGEDDPQRRGALIEHLHRACSWDDLTKLLPDTSGQIRALINLAHPPALEHAVAEPPEVDIMPQAVTFFLTAAQHARLTARLREVHADRSAALVRILHLNHEGVIDAK